MLSNSITINSKTYQPKLSSLLNLDFNICKASALSILLLVFIALLIENISVVSGLE